MINIQQLCREGECVDVECRDHEHCEEVFPDQNGGFLPAKCLQQTCKQVECRNAGHCESNELCDKARDLLLSFKLEQD